MAKRDPLPSSADAALLVAATEAVAWSRRWSSDAHAMQNARTLHYDMAGKFEPLIERLVFALKAARDDAAEWEIEAVEHQANAERFGKELAAIDAALGPASYQDVMDPPDGGDPSRAEMVANLVESCRNLRGRIADLTARLAATANREAEERRLRLAAEEVARVNGRCIENMLAEEAASQEDSERLDWLQGNTIYHASLGEDREADAGFVGTVVGELEARLIDSEGDLRAAIDAAAITTRAGAP